MKLKDCVKGIRVAVICAGKTKRRGTISRVDRDGSVYLEAMLGDDNAEYWAWPEQLRRLKPKPKVDIWTLEEIKTAWDESMGPPFGAIREWDKSPCASAFESELKKLKAPKPKP